MSPPDYSHPYIMDISQMKDKLDGGPGFPWGPIPPAKLKEIILEFVRLHGHCDEARALCSYNIGKIINGEDPIPYPDIMLPSV